MYQNIRQVGAQSTQNTQLSTGLTLGTGVRIVATEKDYTQGSVLQTSGSLDMSVNGRGFLQITMPDGTIAYTRDGSFSLDNQGNVVTASGYPLQPAINIPAGTQSVTIGNDGVVTVTSATNAKGTQVGQIQLADFINVEGLQPTGNNLLVESAASGSPQVGTAGTNGLGTLAQGALETSNVNSVTELVSMIECQRSYEMNSKAISTTDQMLQFLTTNLHMIRIAAILLCCAVSACGLIPHKPPKPDPVVARVLPPPTPRTDGAIYQAGQQIELFADLKARRVGDVLTIRLTETTSASKSAVDQDREDHGGEQYRPDDLWQDHHGIAAYRFSPRR